MSPSRIVSKSSFQKVTLARVDSFGITGLARLEFAGVIADGACAILVGEGIMSVSSDSDMG